MNYEFFLSDLITSLPEINGAFLFTPQDGILFTHRGDSISDFNPRAIGEKMTSIVATASVHLPDITQIQVSFDAMILSGRLLPEEKWLFLLYSPELSSGMIRMALQLALNNSAQENDTPATQAAPATEEPVAVVSPVMKEADPVDLEALMSPGAPLAKTLTALQEELANFIGPAAFPVFQEILTIWCQENSPELHTLKHLIPLLDREIEDSEDINTFHNQIKDLFPQE